MGDPDTYNTYLSANPYAHGEQTTQFDRTPLFNLHQDSQNPTTHDGSELRIRGEEMITRSGIDRSGSCPRLRDSFLPRRPPIPGSCLLNSNSTPLLNTYTPPTTPRQRPPRPIKAHHPIPSHTHLPDLPPLNTLPQKHPPSFPSSKSQRRHR